ncbi:MAG: MgtC/SapB family protein, partial [Candidatus Krumholzibacteria bacterium]|nr:MgtC/SapB family protein [Candidatus Krumholzibacteria bacterium]
MKSFSPLEWSFWLPVLVAVACGMIVGLERQLRGKPLDVRTAVLICLGTHVFIRLGADLTTERVDATRVLGQMVTGVGFLGAG